MFTICRDYLKSVANGIGISDVRFKRGSAQATREVRIFSIPTRGVLGQNFNHYKEQVETYVDPNDRAPARDIQNTTTDTTGNTGTTVKATGAQFVTKGVVADDYFIRDDNNKRSKIQSVLDEDTLNLFDTGITDDKLSFHVSPKDGRPIEKARILKADQTISFIVQFAHRKIELCDADFREFNRNVGKFIYDGQYAQYYKKTDHTTVVTDAKGNKIKINFGRYDFNDNQYYGENPNMIVQEIEFVGGIYLVPDTPTGAIEFDGQEIVVRAKIPNPFVGCLDFSKIDNSQYLNLL